MRSRVSALTLGLSLSFILLACSKKPDQTTDTSGTNPAPAATAPAQTQPAAPMAAEPKPEPIIVPAGTTLTVRLSQAVGSKISQAGQSFSGTVAHAVVIGGKTAIPAGTPVSGTVVDAKPLGRFAGGAQGLAAGYREPAHLRIGGVASEQPGQGGIGGVWRGRGHGAATISSPFAATGSAW